MSDNFLHMNPFLSETDAESMMAIAQAFGSFGTYANEASNEGLGEELPQRFDAGLNYITNGIDGGGNNEDAQDAGYRTNYFRETYAYGNDIKAPGIEPFMEHPLLEETAKRLSGCPIIVPAIIYANLLVPGQELAIHTDVPEFRGANRKELPQWLLVVMLHSGLFEEWRIPIKTCVSWFGAASGGAFAFYPDGANGPSASIPSSHNSAILVDTDQVFHGVERVQTQVESIPMIDKQTRLHFVGDDNWELRHHDELLAEYRWQQIRYSISWKAYCFKEAADEALWRDGSDNLELDFILDRLDAGLRADKVLTGTRPEPTSFALTLAQHYIRFPTAQQAA
jgi:hypothetical protein